ncbi:MAG: DUF3326 domain-containing protein [Oscillatoriales cyanobacterium SM2_2_1]|nr:DUF3326 domain-containing protein [Oscillatoriales cyanobacterium SM2_2_1]
MSISGLRPFVVVVLVPTGIGAALGGYAGDAIPIVRTIAPVADWIITHPNVMNAASLYWTVPNSLYVEGYGLDQFALGTWHLRPVRGNRIAVIFDAAIEGDLLIRHHQAIAAARASLGLDIPLTLTTDEPLGVTLRTADSGATWGTLDHPDSLLRAAERALAAPMGIGAIAIVARFPETTDPQVLAAYRHGSGVDALAGAEAVISHLVVRQFAVPSAHAPALDSLPLDPDVSPRAAAEELGYTFLPSVLVGLSRAPQFVLAAKAAAYDLGADGVSAVVAPATACGGAAWLALSDRGVPCVLVQENRTTLKVTAADLGRNAITVDNYWEAIGVLAALKAGVNPQAMRL